MPCDKRKCRIHKTVKKKGHLSPKHVMRIRLLSIMPSDVLLEVIKNKTSSFCFYTTLISINFSHILSIFVVIWRE